MIERIDPEAWLRARGWTKFTPRRGDPYWRTTPNEPGWEGGWNLGGAVHRELEKDNKQMLQAMGLWQPIQHKRSNRKQHKGATS